MNASLEYRCNQATALEIAGHLSLCDADFVPALSGRVEIGEYAAKIASKALRFEAWWGGRLVGLVAAYCNDPATRIAYITSVSVVRGWAGKGIAADLISRCIEHAQAAGMRAISLEVADNNETAIRLYEKCGFVAGKAKAPFVTMNLYLRGGNEHE